MRTHTHTSPWRFLHMALASLVLAVLAGCFVFDDDVVLLDTGTSRIPLVAHGVWLARISDKNTQTLVIDTADGRIGRMYMLDNERDGKPAELTQVSFLMAPAGGNNHLLMLTGTRANIKSKTGYGPRAEKTVTVWRIERNTLGMVDVTNRDERKGAALAALSRKHGVLLEDGIVKGRTDLAAFKGFVAEATQAGLMVARAKQYQRQRWGAAEWQRFDALRAQLDRDTHAAKHDIEQALREPPSSQAQERLGKLLERANARGSLAAAPEGMLLLAQASRRASPEAGAEMLDTLDLHTRLQAAAYGHVPSQLWVGRHYETRGTHPLDDLRAAIRWYGLAATAGDAEGAAGEMRLKGRFGGLGLK